MKEYQSPLFHDKIKRFDHPSGLTILINEQPEFSKAYAIYATRFGSVNSKFVLDGAEIKLPDGIAHFLEHKLFENPEGDAFGDFGKIGANANAFTDFDMTAYLFSCTDRFNDNLEILLDFVQRPYFTEQSVQKEQGIIGQEIRMYDDDPGWRLTFNLLGALYHEHPVRIDIAGTCETIAEITPELLYQTYEAFYSPQNMVLCVCGNVSASEVMGTVNKLLVDRKNPKVDRVFPQEPETAKTHRITQKLAVSKPLFAIGYKDSVVELSGREAAKQDATMDILSEIICGKGTEIYHELYEQGLINNSFGAGYESSQTYGYLMIEGESENPDFVSEKIAARIADLQAKGIALSDFERCKRAVYGRLMGYGNSPERIGNAMARGFFRSISYYDFFEVVAEITKEEVESCLARLTPKCAALSIVLPEE